MPWAIKLEFMTWIKGLRPGLSHPAFDHIFARLEFMTWIKGLRLNEDVSLS